RGRRGGRRGRRLLAVAELPVRAPAAPRNWRPNSGAPVGRPIRRRSLDDGAVLMERSRSLPWFLVAATGSFGCTSLTGLDRLQLAGDQAIIDGGGRADATVNEPGNTDATSVVVRQDRVIDAGSEGDVAKQSGLGDADSDGGDADAAMNVCFLAGSCKCD